MFHCLFPWMGPWYLPLQSIVKQTGEWERKTVWNSYLPISSLDLQVALQTNAGILYFQTLIPLYVLYCENSKLDPDVWISTWRDVIPPTSEVITQTMIPSSSSTMNSGPPRDMIGMMKRLESNNVFTVASRILENMVKEAGGGDGGLYYLFLTLPVYIANTLHFSQTIRWFHHLDGAQVWCIVYLLLHQVQESLASSHSRTPLISGTAHSSNKRLI